MKRIIFFTAVLLIANLQANSQTGFIFEMGKQGERYVAYTSTPDSYGNTYSVGYNQSIQTGHFKGFLLKVNALGEFVGAVVENKIDTLMLNSDVAMLPNGNVLVVAFTDSDLDVPDNGDNTFIVSEYTPELNLVHRVSHQVPGNADIFRLQARIYNDTLYCFGSKYSQETDYPWRFIYKMSTAGDSIEYHTLYGTVDDIFVSSVSNHLFLVGQSYGSGAEHTINRYNNTTMELEKMYNFFYSVEFYHQWEGASFEIEELSDTSFIFIENFTDFLRIGVMDTALNVLSYKDEANPRGQESFFYHECCKLDAEKNVYIANSNFFDHYFHVRKYDNNLNLLWEKYVDLNNWWVTSSLITTIDGGCLITATYLKSNEMGVRLVKFTANGVVTNVKEQESLISELIIYPNPGAELHVKTAIQKLGGEFTLSDISGKVVSQTTINERETTINTQKLPKGVYFYSYLYQNQVLENGKWLKE